MSLAFRAAALCAFALLSACASQPAPQPLPPAPAPVPVPVPPSPPAPGLPPPVPAGPDALATGVTLELPRVMTALEATRALGAFKASCPVLVRREDSSRLTVGSDWSALCDEASTLDPQFAPGFFFYRFDWVRIGDGRAFATGYYEPEVAGSRVPLPGYAPLHATPSDLVRCTRPDGTSGRGRIDPATGQCTNYFTRGEIEDGALDGRRLELAWVADPVELFFLEIQGSGRVRFPDGSVMRVGYDSQNGRDYVAIGKLLRDRGLLPPGGANMQSIKDWIWSHPDEGKALMRENLSYIFFKELTGAGPLGALGIAVTPNGTVAADPKYVPLGAPVFLKLDRPQASGLWVAQDTGGAIKGPNRFDTFWGTGAEAEGYAGGMSASGKALLLLPKGTGRGAQTRP
ncbi:MAG: MltA domain-containing protein [Pseudomonadota bacterium]